MRGDALAGCGVLRQPRLLHTLHHTRLHWHERWCGGSIGYPRAPTLARGDALARCSMLRQPRLLHPLHHKRLHWQAQMIAPRTICRFCCTRCHPLSLPLLFFLFFCWRSRWWWRGRFCYLRLRIPCRFECDVEVIVVGIRQQRSIKTCLLPRMLEPIFVRDTANDVLHWKIRTARHHHQRHFLDLKRRESRRKESAFV